jgi:hypothetical protein
MHEIELHPGVREEDFENFFLNEVAVRRQNIWDR